MRIISEINELPPKDGFRAVALGNFDGVHIGHQAIIKKTVEKARQQNGTSTVFTFHPHPLKILAPGMCPQMLSGLEEKATIMANMEVDYLLTYRFNKKIAKLSPAEFVTDVLLEGIKADHVFVGYNFSFGKNAEGNSDLLEVFCRSNGCQVTVMPEIKYETISVSSSAIRKVLSQGNVSLANQLLGYPYYITGTVVHGDHRGSTLGFPTANLQISSDYIVPGCGVYAVKALTDKGISNGVANIGYRPTFGCNLPISIEVHLLDTTANLYQQKLRVFFYQQLREEKKFTSATELIAQIERDVAMATDILTRVNLTEENILF